MAYWLAVIVSAALSGLIYLKAPYPSLVSFLTGFLVAVCGIALASHLFLGEGASSVDNQTGEAQEK